MHALMYRLRRFGIALAAAALIAPAAHADPPRHPHDYLRSQTAAASQGASAYGPLDPWAYNVLQDHGLPAALVPQDVRDHAEMKNLLALYGNPWVTGSRNSGGFSWLSFGIGIATTTGALAVLAAIATLAGRLRRKKLAPTAPQEVRA